MLVEYSDTRPPSRRAATHEHRACTPRTSSHPIFGGSMADNIQSVLQEKRTFEPSQAFKSKAHISDLAEYQRLYRQSLDEPDKFWGDAAREFLHWFEPFDKVMEWDEPHVKWFEGGKTNLAYNCLDLQIERGNRNKVAFHWEGEPGDKRTLTYGQMLEKVSRIENVI